MLKLTQLRTDDGSAPQNCILSLQEIADTFLEHTHACSNVANICAMLMSVLNSRVSSWEKKH